MRRRRDFLGGAMRPNETKLGRSERDDALNCNETARFDEIGCNNISRIPVIKFELVLICSKGSSLSERERNIRIKQVTTHAL